MAPFLKALFHEQLLPKYAEIFALETVKFVTLFSLRDSVEVLYNQQNEHTSPIVLPLFNIPLAESLLFTFAAQIKPDFVL